MKRKLIKAAYANCTAAIDVLQELKSQDVKSRKNTKPSRKKKWTKRITAISKTVGYLRAARMTMRLIPKRVS